MEKPVFFKIGNDTVYGILHTPQDPTRSERRVGVLFINAGLRYRTGPYRQYVKFARKLCHNGFYVFRLDAPGTGDSEGYFEDLLEYRKSIVENPEISNSVIEFFMAETGVDQVGLFGLCAGSYDALLTGAINPRVEFLVLLSLPVEKLDGTLPFGAVGIDQNPEWGQLAGELTRAISSYTARGKSAIFIYGERDPYYQAFIDRFGETVSGSCHDKVHHKVHMIRDADHVFSQSHWQDFAIDASLRWLKESI